MNTRGAARRELAQGTRLQTALDRLKLFSEQAPSKPVRGRSIDLLANPVKLNKR